MSHSDRRAKNDFVSPPTATKRKFWRRRRVIEAGGVYEICIRTREYLPFQQFEFIKYLLRSSMARAQMLTGTKICHYVWMGNHCHLIVVPRHQNSLSRFYGILQKSCTDWLKALLGSRQLSLWSSRPAVIALLDSETVAKRIAYLYANPARAGISPTISAYAGLNSYSEWIEAMEANSNFTSISPALKVHPKHLPSLKVEQRISESDDQRLCSQISSTADNKGWELKICPNAWATRFGIENAQELSNLNHRALELTKNYELSTASAHSKKVKNRIQKKYRIFCPYYAPQKYSRKIFVIGANSDERRRFIAAHDRICEKAHLLYQTKYQRGEYVKWPPGIFLAAPPIQGCAIAIR